MAGHPAIFYYLCTRFRKSYKGVLWKIEEDKRR